MARWVSNINPNLQRVNESGKGKKMVTHQEFERHFLTYKYRIPTARTGRRPLMGNRARHFVPSAGAQNDQ
jgi:hypothetical protein